MEQKVNDLNDFERKEGVRNKVVAFTVQKKKKIRFTEMCDKDLNSQKGL